ncbi:FAD binding domain protein [Beauveria brongniartii RCEF 3172]|uniref:FAD binding domain protein n=1 Tax=Beauveria brongniartii RCEF 3172 TaxID=1081107 RepID=A0A167IAI0_9HYPO|nr:FAD binding domain protein [Beauveria brongniartii RCEF 3172]
MEILPTIIATAATSACRFPFITQSALGQRFCPRAAAVVVVDDDDEVQDLAWRLSPSSQVLLPGDEGFFEASRRWSAFDEPRPGIVVIPGVTSDVAKTVQYANDHGTPFLAIGGGQHGATSTLGKLRGGLGIAMSTLDSIELSADGQTAKLGGGALSKTVIDALWEAGKQTAWSGPAWAAATAGCRAATGLIADQFVSMDVVLADGLLRAHHRRRALGPGPGGGLCVAPATTLPFVTSVTLRVHDIAHPRPSRCVYTTLRTATGRRATIIFSGDKVERVFQTLHDTIFNNDAQDVDVVVVVVVWWPSTPRHAAALWALGPVSVEDRPGTYRDLAAWTMISAADAPCQKLGAANLRFGLYLDAYDVSALQRVYDQFAAALRETPAFAQSMFLFENYPVQGLRARAAEDSAFAFRGDSILVAPLINFPPGDEDAARKAVVLGEALRDRCIMRRDARLGTRM